MKRTTSQEKQERCFQETIRNLLLGGLSRNKVAEMVFWSVWIGLLPVPFTHSIGVGIIAWIRRFNVPASIVLAASVFPLELALIVPEYWLGSLLLGEKVAFEYFVPKSIDAFAGMMGEVLAPVILGWLVLGFTVAALMFVGLRFTLSRGGSLGDRLDAEEVPKDV